MKTSKTQTLRKHRRGIFRLAICLTLGSVLGAAVQAQAGSGALGLEDLSIFETERLSIEINLEGALLRMVANAVREDDSDFAQVISGLRAIRVRVTSLEEDALDASARKEIRAAVARLDKKGWKPMVRMREEGDEVYIYLAEDGDRISGLVVLFLEPGDEVGLIHIDGSFDPAQLGRLSESLDLPGLEAAVKAGTGGKRGPVEETPER